MAFDGQIKSVNVLNVLGPALRSMGLLVWQGRKLPTLTGFGAYGKTWFHRLGVQ